MKSRISYLALVLMLAVASILPARADSYKGTMTRQGTKMQYSFSGGVVTDKKLKGQGTTDMIVFIEGQVEAGSTVSATYKKLIDYSRLAHEVQVEISVETTDGRTQYLQDKKGKDAATASIKVPDNAKKVRVKMSFIGRMGHFYCFVDWDVVKKISGTNANEISGTVSGPNGILKYTFSGGTIVKKDIKPGRAYYECTLPVGSSINVYSVIESEIDAGIDMSLSLDGKRTNWVDRGSGLRGARFIFELPSDYPNPDANYSDSKGWLRFLASGNQVGDVNILWQPVSKGKAQPPAPNNNFKWDDVASDDRCPHCHGQFSNYFFRSLSGGDAVTICNSDQKKTNHKLIDGLSPIYYRDWIITGDDETELLLDHCDDMGVMKIMGRSKVLLRNRENGVDNWSIYQGRIVGRHQKSENTPNPFFKMTNCTAQPNGAVYMLVDDHKTSRVFLFKGSIKVSSKKYVFTLKPGQVITVDEYGEVKLQKFDMEAAAKKYGIKIK